MIAATPQRTLVRWGALFAGLVVITAGGWLLMLLGSALGVGVADATDLEALGQAFGITALLWFAVSWIVAYFAGSALAARLAGSPERPVGVLHGITLWGLATITAAVIGYFGVTGLLGATQSMLGGTLGAAKTMVAGATETQARDPQQGQDPSARDGEPGAAGALMSQVRAELKRQASEAMAAASATGARAQALDAQELQEIASQVAAGDREGAERALAAATDLSDDEVSTIVASAAQEAQELDESEGARAVEATLRRQVSRATSGETGADTGARVSEQEARAAIEQLDDEALGTAAGALLTGDTERAKDVLARETNLDAAQVETVVSGVSTRFQARIDEVKTQASQAVEAASTYSQAVLWTAFVVALLGLLAAMAGGALGARAVRRWERVAISRTVHT